jgi:hypothetical protein
MNSFEGNRRPAVATSRKVADSIPDEVNECLSVYLILPAALDPGVFMKGTDNNRALT